LLGTSLLVKPGTELHALQAGIILVIMGLIYLSAKLSGKKYVKRWTFVWTGLFLAYCFRILRGIPALENELPQGVGVQLIEGLLSYMSTVFILLTGLQLLPEDERPNGVRQEIRVSLLVLLLVFLPWLVASALSLDKTAAVLPFASGVMACICTLFTGWRLSLQASFRSSSFPGGVEVLPLFAAYGFLQLGAPWLEHRPWDLALYASALLLKVPCSLSVVAIALRSAFNESKAATQEQEKTVQKLQVAMQELSEKDDDLRKQTDLLTEALQKARAAELTAKEAANAGRIRHTAYQKFGRTVIEERTLNDALQNVLHDTLGLLKARGGALYLRCPEPDPELMALAAVEGVDLGRLPAGVFWSAPTPVSTMAADSAAFLCQALQSYFSPEANIVGLTLSQPEGPQPEGRIMGWIVADVRERGPDFEILKATIDDSLDRVSIGIDLILAREIIGFTESLRPLLREMKPLREQLPILAKLAIEAVGAARATIEVRDDYFGVTHFCGWPLSAQNSLPGPGGRVHSPYPQKNSYTWVEEGPKGDGVLTMPLAVVRVPMVGAQDKRIGVIQCFEKRLARAGDQLAVFNPYDVEKLKAISEMAAGVVERADRQRGIEMLVARSVHELRSPVGRIRNVVRWIQKEALPEATSLSQRLRDQLPKKLRDAAGDAEVLRRLVDQVDVHRGAVREDKTSTRIFGDIIMKETVQLPTRLHELGVPRSNVSIETLSISLIPTMVLNRSTVQQIISNLVENAVKYRNEDGAAFRLHFVGDFDAKYYKIRVRDWGIGVPEGWEDRIFLDGERAPNALRRSVAGMGMGLCIAREMARKMEGDLKLTRRVEPTEFVLELPKGLRQR